MRKTITLPTLYWDRLEEIQAEIGGTISDALFRVVDIGFRAMAAGFIPDLEKAESESESEDEE